MRQAECYKIEDGYVRFFESKFTESEIKPVLVIRAEHVYTIEWVNAEG